jgi:AmmeMemoRadiSam system protein A
MSKHLSRGDLFFVTFVTFTAYIAIFLESDWIAVSLKVGGIIRVNRESEPGLVGSQRMNATSFTPDEAQHLLEIARRTLTAVTRGEPRPVVDFAILPPSLTEMRACFVTYEISGELRGCTGTLIARRPLAEEVTAMAVQTAFHDPRFLPVKEEEVAHITIEISVLTPSMPLHFDSPSDLPRLIRPGIDGVTLKLGANRATFLPQVWEKVRSPIEFLTMLSQKMGLSGDAWRNPKIEAEIYQSITIAEHDTKFA